MTRDELLARAQKRKIVPLDPALLGEGLAFRSLTTRERLDYEDWCETEERNQRRKGAESLAKLVILTLVDADGKPLLTKSDLPAVLDFDAALQMNLFGIAADVNGMGEKAAQDAEKNSETGPCAGSSSSSPGPSSTDTQTQSPPS